MQIVIKISEDAYKKLTQKSMLMSASAIDEAVDAVKKGTPLPKGYGDLIDRNKIAFNNWSVNGNTCVTKKDIFDMPVVVPADEGDD